MLAATVEDHAAFSTSEQPAADVSTLSAACDGRSDLLNGKEIWDGSQDRDSGARHIWCRQCTHGGSHVWDGLLDKLPSRQRMGDDEDVEMMKMIA